MKYEKPEVKLVVDAALCVQHPSQKGVNGPEETRGIYFSLTAYPADE